MGGLMYNRNGPPHRRTPAEKVYQVNKPVPALGILHGDYLVDDGRSVFTMRQISRPLLASLLRSGVVEPDTLPLPATVQRDGRPVLRLVE
jgi:hypothetical protein